jgi:hypothetical protein
MVHNRAFGAFTDGLREDHEPELREWEKIVRAWDEDNEQTNPYEYPDVEGS